MKDQWTADNEAGKDGVEWPAFLSFNTYANCFRSPSPEPIYNNEGKRLNTREYRTRKKLEDDRHQLIQQVMKANPDYKPPADYRLIYDY